MNKGIPENRYLIWSGSSDDSSYSSSSSGECSSSRYPCNVKKCEKSERIRKCGNSGSPIFRKQDKTEAITMPFEINDPRMINLGGIFRRRMNNSILKSDENNKKDFINLEKNHDHTKMQQMRFQICEVHVIYNLSDRRDSITTLTSCSLDDDCDDTIDSYSTISDDESIYEILDVPF